MRTGQVDGPQRSCPIEHRHIEPPRRAPKLQPLCDCFGVACRGCHIEMLRTKTRANAIIEDDAFLGAHDAIPGPADGQIGPAVDVDPFEKLGCMWPNDVDFAQGADINDSHARTNCTHLGRGIAVTLWAFPLAGVQPASACNLMPVM